MRSRESRRVWHRRWEAAGLLCAVLFAGWGGAVEAAPEGSGLPLPRFVSLRAEEVNMRAGPGIQYPIEWVYHRQSMPVEVIAEYRTWRKIRDWQGAQGWVHQSMVSGRRTLVTTGDLRTVRTKPSADSEAVARVEPGVVGHIIECSAGNGWCRIKVGSYVGWLRRVDFWGVYGDEEIK